MSDTMPLSVAKAWLLELQSREPYDQLADSVELHEAVRVVAKATVKDQAEFDKHLSRVVLTSTILWDLLTIWKEASGERNGTFGNVGKRV